MEKSKFLYFEWKILYKKWYEFFILLLYFIQNKVSGFVSDIGRCIEPSFLWCSSLYFTSETIMKFPLTKRLFSQTFQASYSLQSVEDNIL